MDSRKLYIGWAQAFFSVLVLWGISNVFMAYSTQVLHVNKVVFACVTYASCSLLLLLYAGKGALSKETLRSVDTWGYGIIMLINYFITLNLFSVVTASEASLLQRFSVIISLLFSWTFLMRKPTKGQIIGATMIGGGILFIASGLPEEIKMNVYILMFSGGIFQSLRIFVAELHRPHKKAAEELGVKSRCRVVGYVMLAITVMFIVLVSAFSLLQSSVPVENRIGLFVELKDFVHAPSIVMGMIMGLFIYTPIRYLEFSSTHIIKTENFLAVTALSFLSTIIWEWATLPLTGLSLITLSRTDIIAGSVVTAGALVMAISKMRNTKENTSLKNYLYVESQNLEIVDDSQEILANTLEHFSGDVKKSATALGVPVETIEALLQDKDKVLAFKSATLKKVARNYRNKVSTSDALTGILNRGGFMAEAKKLLEKAGQTNQQASLLFIDLDKFKPVNDTYGHDAGDFILKSVAERLLKITPQSGLVTRLGGDEFCVLLDGVNSKEAKIQTKFAQKQAKLISEEIAKPFNFKGKKITIGASVGIANYPEDGRTTEELLKHADVGMYDEKKER